MKKKLIGAILIVIIVTVLILTYLYIQPQTQPLKYDCTLQKGGNTYGLLIKTYNERTLFRCVLNINYLAKNGTWITISKALGVVDNAPKTSYSFILWDYQAEPDINFKHSTELIEEFYFNETTKLETIKINAYGYRNP